MILLNLLLPLQLPNPHSISQSNLEVSPLFEVNNARHYCHDKKILVDATLLFEDVKSRFMLLILPFD